MALFSEYDTEVIKGLKDEIEENSSSPNKLRLYLIQTLPTISEDIMLLTSIIKGWPVDYTFSEYLNKVTFEVWGTYITRITAIGFAGLSSEEKEDIVISSLVDRFSYERGQESRLSWRKVIRKFIDQNKKYWW